MSSADSCVCPSSSVASSATLWGMTTIALALLADSTVTLRVLDGGGIRERERRHRAMRRGIVGGCPEHWWKPTALRTTACTCDPVER
jgi:hypothetical protein